MAKYLFYETTKVLEEQGFKLKRVSKGSHYIFHNAERNITVPIPHRLHDRGMQKNIYKQAGVHP